LSVTTSNHPERGVRVVWLLKPTDDAVRSASASRQGISCTIGGQVDDEVPHDRPPLFDPWVLIAAIRFPVFSRDPENGLVIATEWLRGFLDDETASRVRDHHSSQSKRLAHGAKHNAAKRNMIAWRRCVSMLDAQIPSKALSVEAVPRFDAAEPYGFNRRSVDPSGRPTAGARQMLSHSLQAFSVVAALSPLLKERLEDHRQIKGR